MSKHPDEQFRTEIARSANVPVIFDRVEEVIRTNGGRDAWEAFVTEMFGLLRLVPNPPHNMHERIILELRAFSAPIADLRERVIGFLAACVGAPVADIERASNEARVRRLAAILDAEDEEATA